MFKLDLWVKTSGQYNESNEYVGGDCERLLVNNNIDFNWITRLVIEILNLNMNVCIVYLKFILRIETKPP